MLLFKMMAPILNLFNIRNESMKFLIEKVTHVTCMR
jgi:hypothetical protein